MHIQSKRIANLLVCVALLSGMSGCGQRKATCETATDHVMSLQASTRPTPLDSATSERRRKRSIEQCEARKTSTKVLECILSARTRTEVIACDPKAADTK